MPDPILDEFQVRGLAAIAAQPVLSSAALAERLGLELTPAGKAPKGITCYTGTLQSGKFANCTPFQGWTATELGRSLAATLTGGGLAGWTVISWERDGYAQIGYVTKFSTSGSRVTIQASWMNSPDPLINPDPEMDAEIVFDLASAVSITEKEGSIEFTTPGDEPDQICATVTLARLRTPMSRALLGTLRPAA